jgi:dipeptidyl aminopeptidase/acylaminoacyl peptidase
MDRNIPYTQSLNLYNALKPVKGAENVTYELLEGAGHGGSQFSSAANLAKVVAFFEKYLK